MIKQSYLFRKPILICLLAVFVLNSCQKEQNASTEDLRPQQTPVKVTDLLQQGKLVSVLELSEPTFNTSILSTRGATSRNADGVKVPQAFIDFVHEHQELLERMINPEDFDCGPTFLNEYTSSLVRDLTEEDLELLNTFSIIPFFEAVFFDDIKDKDYFGYEGRFTSAMRYTFVDLRGFWDVDNEVKLSDAHGTVFENVPLVAQIIQFAFVNFDEEGNPVPIPGEVAFGVAQQLSEIFGSDRFDNYNHPFLSFNAIYYPGSPELGVPPTIAMGDGIMETYAKLGLGSMAERLILAHEYGHHIHISNGIITPFTPEGTRFTELLADTYAAYYATHGKGLFLQPLVVERYVTTAFSIGDCGFGSPNHHGTPNQRARAAALGGSLAKQVGLFDPEYTSQEIFEIYLAAFPLLIKPDAE